MMNKLTARVDKHDKIFKPQIYQRKGEDRPGITIIKEITRWEIDLSVKIEGYCIDIRQIWTTLWPEF